MGYEIVKLKQEDVELLVSLAELIDFRFMGMGSKYFSSLTYRYEWLNWLGKGMHIWGIMENGQLVAAGSLDFYLNRKCTSYETANEAVLTNDMVHPDYRGRGYHRILISTRIKFCLRNKIYGIHSIVKTENIPCIENFKRMKFSEKLVDYQTEPILLFSYKNYLMLYFFKVHNYVLALFKT